MVHYGLVLAQTIQAARHGPWKRRFGLPKQADLSGEQTGEGGFTTFTAAACNVAIQTKTQANSTQFASKTENP
jgi:hypothetical protein